MPNLPATELNTILAVDCGSTTTKAILFGRDEAGVFRTLSRGEAPTTVEAPFEDVMVGLRNAIAELEDLTKRRLLGEDGRLVMPAREGAGIDLFCATSSAGGGLQMMVTGLVRTMTAESAQRAALGAGAIVMDVLSADDGRAPHERVRRVRHLRPDIVLLSGGVDGGAVAGVVEFAELLVAADPKPRFGTTFRLPVVFAGNKDAVAEVEKLSGDKFAMEVVANIRPTLERENLGPARAAIHEAFLNHVMSHAPGYDTLMKWASVDILSTPDAVGRMAQAAADVRGQNILAVDIGGATTDVFSVFAGEFHRTVSANLGMSYSLANVVVETGADNILRWLPFEIGQSELRDRLRNKMVRPTTVPETVEDLLVEQAAAREALRLALAHHKSLARPLKGVVRQRSIGDTFDQSGPDEDIIDMAAVGLVIGSGGVLSHAPNRSSALLMMIDAFEPCGVAQMAVDSIFMMPHLGAFSTVNPKAAAELFERDCLVHLGAVVAPRGRFPRRGAVLEAELGLPSGRKDVVMEAGAFARFDLAAGERANVVLRPARGVDVGVGAGETRTLELLGGEAGVVIDCRGRPLVLPDDEVRRRENAAKWLGVLGLPTK
jgi:uncharacterized protein (TIGR01319 family)